MPHIPGYIDTTYFTQIFQITAILIRLIGCEYCNAVFQ